MHRWKSLYFLKGFKATGTLVQMVTQTVVEVRWFLLMLVIISAFAFIRLLIGWSPRWLFPFSSCVCRQFGDRARTSHQHLHEKLL